MFKRLIEKFRRKGLRGTARTVFDRAAGKLFSQAHPITSALRSLVHKPSVSIVQIGAFVGPSNNDPVWAFIKGKAGNGLLAVLVEPVKEYFHKLQENYKGLEGVHFENIAIAETSGEKDFYRLGVRPGDHGFPDWLEQLGSLRADRMTDLCNRHEADTQIKEFYRRHRIAERVQCLTLPELLAKFNIRELDLLQIDAEGYDYEILKTIDFQTLRPRYINYESCLLGIDEEVQCRSMLTQAGYRLLDFNQDTFCVRKGS